MTESGESLDMRCDEEKSKVKENFMPLCKSLLSM